MINKYLEEIGARRAEMKELATRDQLDATEEARFDSLQGEIEGFEKRIARQSALDEIDKRAAGHKLNGNTDSKWEGEKREFSLLRAIGSQVPELGIDAGREKEISAELQRRSGKPSEGMMMPYEAFEARAASDVSTTVPSGGPGSNAVATNLLAGNFINLLRENIVTAGLGATMLSGLVGNPEVPRQKAASTAGWVAEDGDLTASAIQVDKVALAPKHVGALTELSRNMLIQTTPDMENLVRADFAAVMARAIDNGVVNGTGTSGQPTGITVQAGTSTVAIATNGGAPTYNGLLNLIYAIIENDSNMAGFMTNPKVVKTLRKTLRTSADAASNFIMNDDAGSLLGYPVRVSNVISSAGTKGTGSSLSTIIAGNWQDVLIGTWEGIEILVNPYAESSYLKGAVQVRAFATMDVAIRHPESFAITKDVVTS